MAVAAVDAGWIALGGYAVKWASLVTLVKAVAFLVGAATALRAVSNLRRYRIAAARLHYARFSNMTAWCGLMSAFTAAACILSYLCVSINAPVIDHWLTSFDQALGFDWPGVYVWVRTHPLVHEGLALAYRSGHWQLIAIPIILGLFGEREELSEFFLYFAIAVGYTLLISTPFPATSAFVRFDVDEPSAIATVSDFSLLRDGSLSMIDLANIQGLVSLPSFHTALALLFTYSLRKIRLLFWIAVPLNTVMILSTPTEGGHYLADVLAGGLLFALTLLTCGTIIRRYKY